METAVTDVLQPEPGVDRLATQAADRPMAAGGSEIRGVACGVSAQELGPLWFVRYRMRLVPRSPLALPLHGRGAIIRGAFGVALRGLVCHDMTLDCRACPLKAACPYPETFEPTPPPGGDRLSTFSDIPRPFVFDLPDDGKTEYRPGETLEIGLTAIGRASRLVPYFVTTFRKLADDGIGPRRARFELAEVVALGPEDAVAAARSIVPIYKQTESLVRVAAPAVRAADLVRHGDAERTRLKLRFVTPMELRDRGQTIGTPELGPLLRRLRDRASSLAAFFGDGPLKVDFRGIGTLADTVKLVENRTLVLEVSRRSTRTGQRHDVGGFVGEATYEGAGIGRLMALVRVGEVVHAGKHAAFGNGRMEVVG